MRGPRLGLLVCTCVCGAFAVPAHGRPGAPVPATLASAIEGCWDLGPRYRITLHRAKDGLTVQQEADRFGKPVKRQDEARYNAQTKTLTFDGIGRIHRTVITLKWSDTGGLESAFSSEITRGQWLHGTWSPAARCPATGG